jgi:acetolactate synthase-1/2/3 large subunit
MRSNGRRVLTIRRVQIPKSTADIAEAVKKAIAANKPYLIDVDIAADTNPAGAGVWELPGLGVSKPSIGKQFIPG